MRSIFGGMMIALLLQMATASAQDEVVATFKFFNTPPKIDGVGDDPAWQDADSNTLDDFFTLGEELEDDNDLAIDWRAGYDNDNLYFWAAVSDDEIIGANAEDSCNWQDDGVELYIDSQNLDVETFRPGMNPEFEDGVPAYQLTVLAGDNFESFCNEIADDNHFIPEDSTSAFRWGINSYDGADEDTRYPKGADTSVTLVVDDNNYTFEAAIPWEAIESTPEEVIANGGMGFGVAVNDDDTFGGRDTQMMWATPDGNLWQRSDVFPHVALEPGASDPCDVNGDGTVDAADIDAAATAARDAGEDTAAAVAGIVKSEDCFHSWIGDSNLDGEFNSSDFVGVFQEGKYETGDPATWSQGDWNGDGVFDSGDFVAAFQDGGFELGPRWQEAVSSVPEPTGAIVVMFSVLGIFLARRHS